MGNFQKPYVHKRSFPTIRTYARKIQEITILQQRIYMEKWFIGNRKRYAVLPNSMPFFDSDVIKRVVRAEKSIPHSAVTNSMIAAAACEPRYTSYIITNVNIEIRRNPQIPEKYSTLFWKLTCKCVYTGQTMKTHWSLSCCTLGTAIMQRGGHLYVRKYRVNTWCDTMQ